MKSILKKVAGFAVTVVLAFGIVGCVNELEVHEHTFASKWSNDATDHWHAATCEHSTEVKDKAAHTFGEWKVTLAATGDAEGKQEKECTVCGYKVEETIEKLEHVHKVGTKHEAVAGNCVEKAIVEYYDCAKATCDVKLDAEGNPLSTIEGEIDPSVHKSTETTWTTTETTHKETYNCCGAVKTEEAEHTFGEWTETVIPTAETEGKKEKVCSVCGYKVEETVEKHVHAVGLKHEAVAGNCVEKATVEYYDCTKPECKVKLNAERQPLSTIEGALNPLVHKGTETTWIKTATTHKEIYDCCGAVKTEETEHSFGEWTVTAEATEEAEGSKKGTCDVCGYEKTQAIIATPKFSVAAGNVDEDTKVEISCATANVKIYYTTDGSEPTTSNSQYNNAINVTKTVTIKAIAVKEGMADSGVATAEYKVLGPFVMIPAGTFRMGSEAQYSASKVHNVTITKPFYICDHEVTQEEYKAIMGENPSTFQGSRYEVEGENSNKRPADKITWYQAVVYCNKRSKAEGLTPCYQIDGTTNTNTWTKQYNNSNGGYPSAFAQYTECNYWDKITCDWEADGYRLPTVAEWEYAARAGDDTVDAFIWSGTSVEEELDDYAWFNVEKNGYVTHEVKKKKPNAFGLYDMCGNVEEWCWDWSTINNGEDAIDPHGKETGSVLNKPYPDDRMCCGGSFEYENAYGLVINNNSDGRFPYVGYGFRVVRNCND